jgi:hypothetical protein
MQKDYLFLAIRSLKPSSQFTYEEQDYSSIKWDVLEGEAPTQAEIDAAIEQVKIDETQAEAAKAADKAALLNRLGITAEEAKLLLS